MYWAVESKSFVLDPAIGFREHVITLLHLRYGYNLTTYSETETLEVIVNMK